METSAIEFGVVGIALIVVHKMTDTMKAMYLTKKNGNGSELIPMIKELHTAHLGPNARLPEGGLKWYTPHTFGKKLDALVTLQQEVLAELKIQTAKIDLGDRVAESQTVMAQALTSMAGAAHDANKRPPATK